VFLKQPNRVELTVRRPHAGKTISFETYRVEGGLPMTAARFAQRVQVGTPWPFPAGTTQTVTITDTNVQPNKQYTYFVLAIMENPDNPSDPIRSGISSFRVVNTK
jgi:hypothetical protein